MFGSGKIQMLQSQLREATDNLEKVTREKQDLEGRLATATSRIADLEEKLTDFDLEQLKEQARASQAEFEGLRELYSKKIKDFEDVKEEAEEDFARESALKRHNLENEIQNHRQESQDYVANTVKNFSESYNYYMSQIKLLMDALGEVAVHTGENLFAGIQENLNLKESIGQGIVAKLKPETDTLRSEENGLVLIADWKEKEEPEEMELEEAIPAEEDSLEEELPQELPEEPEEDFAGETAEEIAEGLAEELAMVNPMEDTLEAVEETLEAAEETAEDAVEAADLAEEAAEAAEEAADLAEEAAEVAEEIAEATQEAAEEVVEEVAEEAAEEIAETAE